MDRALFKSRILTEPFGFTPGIEGPACDLDGNLYAVNFARNGTIGKVTPQGEADIFLDLPGESEASGIRFHPSGDMYIADHRCHNIWKAAAGTKRLSIYAHEPAMHQPNDLAIASSGMLFASDPDWKDSSGQLWRIDAGGQTVLLETGMGTTNGIELSPDEKTLYVNETKQRKIWAYDLSPKGEISNKRLLIEFPDYALDGMRCDIQGNLYVTRFGKGVVAVISPQGRLIREIELRGKNCTNLTFGGPDGRNCYVTVSDTGNIETFRTDISGRCWMLFRTSG